MAAAVAKTTGEQAAESSSRRLSLSQSMLASAATSPFASKRASANSQFFGQVSGRTHRFTPQSNVATRAVSPREISGSIQEGVVLPPSQIRDRCMSPNSLLSEDRQSSQDSSSLQAQPSETQLQTIEIPFPSPDQIDMEAVLERLSQLDRGARYKVRALINSWQWPDDPTQSYFAPFDHPSTPDPSQQRPARPLDLDAGMPLMHCPSVTVPVVEQYAPSRTSSHHRRQPSAATDTKRSSTHSSRELAHLVSDSSVYATDETDTPSPQPMESGKFTRQNSSGSKRSTWPKQGLSSMTRTRSWTDPNQPQLIQRRNKRTPHEESIFAVAETESETTNNSTHHPQQSQVVHLSTRHPSSTPPRNGHPQNSPSHDQHHHETANGRDALRSTKSAHKYHLPQDHSQATTKRKKRCAIL